MPLKTRARTFDLSTGPLLMGVLNITPDSFSDGGQFFTPEAALARAEELVEDGADILDVGGESSRPGALPVPLGEEIRRVIPVVEVLAQRFPRIAISVDTTKAEVARRSLDEGASLINDISALRFDPKMAEVVKDHEVPIILMHMQGDPRTMQSAPLYNDVVQDIHSFFHERIAFALAHGLTKEQILLDPGIGFGKSVEHNLDILRNISSFLDFGLPLLVGPSRKTFISKILAPQISFPSPLEGEGAGPTAELLGSAAAQRAESPADEGGKPLNNVDPFPPEDREEGTLASCLWAAQAGAHILRVHNVKSASRALKVWKALSRASVPAHV